MPDKMLFLLSSRSGFDTVSDEFVPAAGGKKAVIVLLIFRGGEAAQKYINEYTEPWRKRGIAEYLIVMPDASGKLDVEAAVKKIDSASGIFIGGGDTERYREMFATGKVGQLINNKYERCIPVAGCSAGALIMLKKCPMYNYGNDNIVIKPALGLLKDVMVEVHFSERDRMKPLLEAMKITRIKKGLGIDEPACAVFKDGKLVRTLGKSVYEISVKNFEPINYEKKRL